MKSNFPETTDYGKSRLLKYAKAGSRVPGKGIIYQNSCSGLGIYKEDFLQ